MLLAAAMVLSLPIGVIPARAAGSLPTEVSECGTSGFMPEFLCVGFENKDDQNWLNAITTVTVNGSEYTHRASIGSFESNVGKAWTIGSYMGSYGSYPAIKIVADAITYPATINVSADGYPDAVITVTKPSYYSYTAEIKENSSIPEPTEYTITVGDGISNGTVSTDKDKAEEGDTIKVTASPADGYSLDQITVTDGDGRSVAVSENGEFTMPASNVTVSATFQKKDSGDSGKDPSGLKEIKPEQVSVSERYGSWYFTVSDDDAYVGEITGLSVNDTAWEETPYGVYTGGKYRLYSEENQIEIAEQSYGSPAAIKSGDVITITADGYKDLVLKFVVDKDGKAYVTADDGEGDLYELHVKLVGSFEAAITGQDYDAVSGATGMGAQTSKYSDVTVYGALVEKGKEPADDDWKKLESWSSDINLDSTKCKVIIESDTENGTAVDADSGMSGVYFVISSDLTLSGTAKDVGQYLVSISVTDTQGRTATSNKLPFRIYSGEETLADQMVTGNMVQTQDGKYMWDIQEPWAIKNFGSNVTDEEESVRVLEGLKAWYGSHTSGTYGYLGYDIPWKDVEEGKIPQTLYIPSGCNLTLVNMKILSSVRIVIEDGGKLTLRDSVVQGIIDVKKGGTFSMNYDDYKDEFLTGASVCGQIRLEDGAILENAAIYSHANYVANGDLDDRTTTEPVVTTTGNVTIKGDVYIEGDGAGRDCGQTGLLVKDGTLTVGEGSTLVVFGGESMNGWDGGTAIKLDNGTITGDGKLVAIGGEAGPVQGDGGDAVSGNGTISTDETFLRGATAYDNGRMQPGQAVDGDNIKIDSESESIEDGVIKDLYGDPYKKFYWKTGIDPQPPLEEYVTDAVQKYTITVKGSENGTAAASAATAKAGAEITITTTPDDGYELASLLVTAENGEEILSWQKSSRAVRTDRFIMPASNVTVTAAFTKEAKKEDAGNKGTDSGNKGDAGTSGSSSLKHSSGSGSSSGSTTQSGVTTAANSAATNAGTNVTVNNTMDAAATGTATAQSASAAMGAENGAASATETGHIIATGDDTHMNLWLTIMLLSAAVLAGTTAYNRKRVSDR